MLDALAYENNQAMQLVDELMTDNAALRARVAALEGENERLRNQDCPIVGSAHCPVTAALRSLLEETEEVKNTLRARIATLEAQLEQARTALEGICRCDRYPMHCAECPAAQSYCASLIAGQALREGGKNGN